MFLVTVAIALLSIVRGVHGLIPYEPVRGAMAAVYTPFDDDGKLNLDIVREQAAYLNKTHVRHVLVAGTTGESVSLTTEERMMLAEEWAKIAPEFGIRIYVHVGTNALGDARALAAHAEGLHAAGVVSMSTTYFRPGTVEQLAAEMKYVFDAAPNTPCYYYHIPSMTMVNGGVGFDMLTFLQIANGTADASLAMPNLVGIKFTDVHIYPFRNCIRAYDRAYDMLYGRDEQAIGAAIMGARGAVGSTYNFLGLYIEKIFDLYLSNTDEALKAQDMIDDVVFIYQDDRFAGCDVGKAMMNLLGVNVGPPRLPTNRMTSDQMELLKKLMQDIGLLQ